MASLLRAPARCSGNGPVWTQVRDAVDAVIEDRGDFGALCLARVKKPRTARLHRFVEWARVTRPRLDQGLVVAAPAAVNEAEPDHGEQAGVKAQAESAAIGNVSGRDPAGGQTGQVVQREGTPIGSHGLPEVDAAQHGPRIFVTGAAEEASTCLVHQAAGRGNVEPPGGLDRE